MNSDVISVEAHTDQEEVAKIFQSYDLVSMPVVDSENKVIGKISIDDVVDVIEEEYSENVARMAGTDAEELEKKSPFQIAKLRLPWLLVTLFIEFIAVFVVQSHDEIHGKDNFTCSVHADHFCNIGKYGIAVSGNCCKRS